VKEYKVYANPQGEIQAVKQGWSWPAFFFGCIWAVVKKMWLLGLGVFAALVILQVVLGNPSTGSDDALVNLLSFAAAIIFGVNGNKWRASYLLSHGYDFEGEVEAANPEAAIASYLKQR
jgi:hypothetical protein